MRYLALAVDYDGTGATHDHLSDSAVRSIERLRVSGLSRHEAVAIGDAENDHSLLEYCECGVAVANAVPSLKKIAAFVTRGANGDGVAELIDELIANDLQRMDACVSRSADPLDQCVRRGIEL